MVVGLLGVLKAGGAYVPLDSVYPVDRLAYMVQDAEIEVLLTQSKLQKRLPDYAGRLIELDVDGELIASESEISSVSVARVIAENLAYVIYTSGSTGKPKGVMVEHRQVCNQLFWAGAASRWVGQTESAKSLFQLRRFDIGDISPTGARRPDHHR